MNCVDAFDQRWSRAISIAAPLIAALVLLFLVTRSPHYLIYDEGIYLTGALILVDGHGFAALLLSPFSIPTGPLHAVIHALLAPLTSVEAPAVRWINPALLTISWLCIGYGIAAMGYEMAFVRSAAIIGVPVIWASTGMALTELPAMTMASIAVAATAWGITSPIESPGRLWTGFLLAGLALGFATLGRQLYLPGAIGFVLIAAAVPRVRAAALAAATVTALTVAPVFVLWSGVVPPSTPEVSGSLSIRHGFLAIAYVAIVIAIVAPSFYLRHWKWCVWPAVGGGLAGLAIGDLGFEAAQKLSQRLPVDVAQWFQRLAVAALAGAGCAFIAAALCNLWSRRSDQIFTLNMILTFGYTLTAAGVVHQFSSRYLLTAFPILMLAIQPYYRPTVWSALRLLAGAALGVILLTGYYDKSGPQILCSKGEYRTFCNAP